MNMIPQTVASNNCLTSFQSVSQRLGVFKHLKSCGFKKRNGASVDDIISTVLYSKLKGHENLYRYYDQTRETPTCSDHAIYRFLKRDSLNWEKHLMRCSKEAIELIEPLTGSDRIKCFVLDDSMLERPKAYKTELAGRLFDHVFARQVIGFADLQIGWTDGNSFIPVSATLVTSGKDELIVSNHVKSVDKRTCAHRIREQARTKKNDLVVDIIKRALNMGIEGEYILMDTWFYSDKMFVELGKLGVSPICMLKQNRVVSIDGGVTFLKLDKVLKHLSKSGVYSNANIINSVEAVTKGGIRLKLVFVKNYNDPSKFIVIATTDISLSEDKIIQLYTRRWFIETNFKAQKSYLGLDTECQAHDFDTINSFVHIANLRFLILEILRRLSNDPRSQGELFRLINKELQEQPFVNALTSLVRMCFDIPKILVNKGLLAESKIAEAQQVIDETIDQWASGITKFLQKMFIKKQIS